RGEASAWSPDGCSSDLVAGLPPLAIRAAQVPPPRAPAALGRIDTLSPTLHASRASTSCGGGARTARGFGPSAVRLGWQAALHSRSEARRAGQGGWARAR